MTKKMIALVVLVIAVLALAACSGSAKTTGQNQQNAAANLKDQPVENKLALGTIALEGTAKAVTADQAKALLPLWKAVKSMGSSTTATTDEVNALYKQIEEGMTADQMQAIKDLNPTQTEMQAIFQKAGVQMPQGPQGAPQPSGTRTAGGAGNTSGQGGFAGGPGGGQPPADFGGGGPGGQFPGGQTGGTNSAVRGTPQPGQGQRPVGGMNRLLADALIKLLETRAGA